MGNADDMSFNHPMVKVKGAAETTCEIAICFNHPMVKVKDICSVLIFAVSFTFQPPYGES